MFPKTLALAALLNAAAPLELSRQPEQPEMSRETREERTNGMILEPIMILKPVVVMGAIAGAPMSNILAKEEREKFLLMLMKDFERKKAEKEGRITDLSVWTPSRTTALSRYVRNSHLSRDRGKKGH